MAQPPTPINTDTGGFPTDGGDAHTVSKGSKVPGGNAYSDTAGTGDGYPVVTLDTDEIVNANRHRESNPTPGSPHAPGSGGTTY